MTRQLGKGIHLGLYEDQYVGLLVQFDEGEVLTLHSAAQAILLSNLIRDKATELLELLQDENNAT